MIPSLFFPRTHITRNYLKEGMRKDGGGLMQKIVSLGRPCLELIQEMLKFVFQLFVRQEEAGRWLALIERNFA